MTSMYWSIDQLQSKDELIDYLEEEKQSWEQEIEEKV